MLKMLLINKQLGLEFAQIFALIPGTSRAGSSIIGAMLVGLNRKTSAEFSFFLAFPVMCATTGLWFIKTPWMNFSRWKFLNLAVGFVVSLLLHFFNNKVF